MSAKKDDFTLFRNDPQIGLRPSPGRPASSTNAALMRAVQKPERFSAGFILNRAGKYAQQVVDDQIKKLATEMELGQLVEDIKLRSLCSAVEKLAGEEREPEVDDHASSPTDKMRPRAELVLYTREGVYGIDKGDYMLFPGGAVDDGEQPRDAAIRETLEEANRHPVNVEGAAVVEAIWPEDSGNEFWDDSEFDGERTYFFCGLDRGDAGISHDDLEDFQVIPFNTAIAKLDELINREDQQWAKRNNEVRKELVKKAKRLVSTVAGRSPNKQASVAPYKPPEEDDKENPVRKYLKSIGLGLAVTGGVGTAATQYPDWFLSNEEQDKVKRFVEAARDRWHGPVTPPRQAAREYASLGSEASSVTPFGLPMSTLMRLVRKYVPGNPPWQGESSSIHYDTFSKGPLAAHLLRLKEYQDAGYRFKGGGYHRLTKPEFSFSDAPEEVLPHDLRTDEGRQFLEEHFRQLKDEIGGDIPTPTELSQRINTAADQYAESLGYELPEGEGASALPRKAQYKVLEGLDNYLKEIDPEAWKAKQVSEFDMGLHGVDRYNPESTIQYSIKSDKPLQSIEFLKKAFPAALATGGGLLGLYLLINALRKKDENKEVKEAQAAPELNVPVEQGNVDMQPRAGTPADAAVSPVTGIPMSEARSFVQRIVQNIQPAQPAQPQAPSAPTTSPQAGTLTPTENAAQAPQPAVQPKMAFLDSSSMQPTMDDPFITAKDVQQDVEGGMHGAPSAREQIAWAQSDPVRRAHKNRKELLKKKAVIKEEDGKFVLYTKDGNKVLGRHDSKKDALAQERAVQASKHAAEDGEALVGGYADNEPAEKYDARELVDGVLVELEHTNDGKEALEIAKDHLEEIPDYYSRLGELEDDAKEDAGYGDKSGYEKKADLAQFLPQSQHILFTPDGRVVVRRGINRRFVLPVEGPGRAAPYEDPVKFVPEGGIPQEGYHGYTIGTRIGEVDQVPEGFEALPAESVLNDLYASMGLSVNKPFRQIDRARVRTILRYMKKRKRQQEQAMEQAPPQPLPQAPFDFREA